MTAVSDETDLKRNEVLCFDDGLLTIKISGHGAGDGWGSIAFHERQIDIDADGFHVAEIPPSELRALRDFLNRVIPDALSAAPVSDAVATVTYTNWRGETSVRRIIPKSVRYGSTEWHPEPQWLLLAWDDDKKADREFALKDFGVAPVAQEPVAQMTFFRAMGLAERGFENWKAKEHNAKWFKRIDGTPIPNDLLVNIAEAFCNDET